MNEEKEPSEATRDQLPVEAVPPAETVESSQAEPSAEEQQEQPRRRWLWVLLGYIALLLIVGGIAYIQGTRLSNTERAAQIALFNDEQYALGVADLEAGRYDLARQRFEAIIRQDPGYPGAEDRLIEALIHLDVPTLTPTPSPSATPDPSPPAQLFEQAQAALDAGDWDLAVDKLLALRAKDPDYRPVDVDGMLFTALLNRGMEMIAQGLMEEGLYELSLAEQFGPLGRDALFRQSLAEQYLLANSYMGINWAAAAELFGPLCDQGATSDSCYKFAEASWEYGDQLWSADDPCGANAQYDNSMRAYPSDLLAPTATRAARACATATAPPPPPPVTETPTITLTPTPTDDGGGGGGDGGGGE